MFWIGWSELENVMLLFEKMVFEFICYFICIELGECDCLMVELEDILVNVYGNCFICNVIMVMEICE